MNNLSSHRQARRLAQRRIAGELFIVDPRNKCLHQPRGAGEDLWEWLSGGASEGDLVRNLLNTYEVTPETATRDVRKFLKELRRKKLLEEAE